MENRCVSSRKANMKLVGLRISIVLISSETMDELWVDGWWVDENRKDFGQLPSRRVAKDFTEAAFDVQPQILEKVNAGLYF